MTDQPPTEQQLDEIAAIAARATDDPFYVSDCEGSLQVWREKALTHVRRDASGEIDMYSFPSTYKVTDQVIELDLSTWDPGEDATDDQQRQDIRDLVEARAAMPLLLAEVRRLHAERARHDAEVMRRCAAFVRDTYDGEWVDDAAATLERDADIAEHGCPGFEAAYQGPIEAERRLGNCKHCGRAHPDAASEATSAPLRPVHASSVSESAQSPTGAPEGALRPSLSVEASEACGKCKQPFDPADTRFDGRARYHLTPFCRSCVDHCHDTEIADHRCVICA